MLINAIFVLWNTWTQCKKKKVLFIHGGILCGSAKSLWWLQGHMTLFCLLSSGFNIMLLLLWGRTKMEMGLRSISVIASISWPLAVKTLEWKSEESAWFPREARMLISKWNVPHKCRPLPASKWTSFFAMISFKTYQMGEGDQFSKWMCEQGVRHWN